MNCYCGKLLTGRQTKYCSEVCSVKVRVADWRRNLKKRAVEYKGGSCNRCGYNKYIGALAFHHVNGKDFGIAEAGRTISWDRVKEEIDKCLLLCANCHAEVHEEERHSPVAPR